MYACPTPQCGPVTQSHRATSCNRAPHLRTPLHQAFCPPGPRRAGPGPLAARPANSGARERFTLPHNTAGDTQFPALAGHDPAPTARRLRGPCSPRAPRTPQLWGAGRPTPPPLRLAPTPSPSRQLAARARAHTRPTPPPTCPTGGRGHRAAELTLPKGRARGPPPRPRAIASPRPSPPPPPAAAPGPP